MIRKITVFGSLLALCLTFAVSPAAAEDQINYISQPDALVVFLNNIAYVRDDLRIPGDAEARVVLPVQLYQDTLIVREGEARVTNYRISRAGGNVVLVIGAAAASDLRAITLEYLTGGLSWKPTYDMTFSDAADSVDFHFFAEVQNDIFSLDGVAVMLAAGSVSTTQQIDDISLITANQYLAGYESNASAGLGQGAVTIQYVYPLDGGISAEPGDMLYTQLLGASLPARRLLLWNASIDRQISVIYKVENASDVPLAEGIVRSYQDGLFVGSDFIEFTPVGSEGSVTVGGVQDVRVNRAETVTYHSEWQSEADTLHTVTLTLDSFSAEPVALEVVDVYPPTSGTFEFSETPAFEPGNLLRWQVTIPPTETVEITYSYRAAS